ncbi:ABC transporter family substrate-binding protein [Thermobifida halotolerans]|uniref:ABC transporter family substrate-binding protein n=1 Tax=Thermobifida halotolerans TaxID=483545 RepID=A0A399G4N4_9ACTN|nr:ABC transporter family substrate-binding protein [Thermobifida halotolerans]UOE20789.1 ABC transporter family substrate-binding protein [Thermobifida halotolerans]
MRDQGGLTTLAASITAATLVLTACAPQQTGGSGGAGGLGDCAENPNTCNSGERADGGSITWIVDSLPGAWSTLSPEGGSVYTIQTLHGILPHTGVWEPDGATFTHNTDLLAEEPRVISEDPFTYRFTIRPEAVWDDGTPISAADFEITWKLGTTKAAGVCEGCQPRSDDYDRIADVEGGDGGSTVTVTLRDGEADPEWMGKFGADDIAGGIYPAHVAEEQGFDTSTPEGVGEYFRWLNTTMPTFSGGPYRLVEGDLENQVIKEPNPAWYGGTAPTLDTVVIRFLTDESTWISALDNGEAHGTSPVAFGQDTVEQARQRPGLDVSITDGPSWEHVDLNLDNEWLKDVELRRAIFTAIDVADIAQRTVAQLHPEVEPRTNHVFSNGSPYHTDVITATGQGSGDTEAARRILLDAGYAYEGETLTLDGEEVGPFRLRSTSNTVRDTSLELIQSYLAEIGITATIEPTDDLGATLAGQDYDIMQYGWSSTPFFVTAPSQYWSSTSDSNFGRYADEEVDELADLTQNAVSLDEAAEYANRAAQLVAEDAYVLPLFDMPVYILVSDDYVNVRDNPSSSLRGLYQHHEWGLAAR